MKISKLLVLATLFFGLAASDALAQCPSGEVEVTIDIQTDNYGYELYWELVPTGNNCGSGTIFSGGNPAVGCNGAGSQNQTPGGYGNNTTISEGPWCLTENDVFDILWADDYGDGGFDAEVFVDGVSIAQFTGASGAPIETFTFTAAPPAQRDMSVTHLSSPKYAFEGANIEVKGQIKSLGLDPVTSFDLNYSIDGGTAVVQSISGVNIIAGAEYSFNHSTPWVGGAAATYTLEVWGSNINGQPDLVPGNDSKTNSLILSAAIPNIIDDYLNSVPVITTVASSNEDLLVPRDLDFHPEMARKELWVVNKDTESSGGSTVTFTNVGQSNQAHEWKRDGNAWHFMSLPTGIAMGDNGLWANSPGVFDANHNGSPPFTGPALWESDMNIYAEPSGGNGSHMDMLHESPYSQGIAHEEGNTYWVVDGHSSEVVRYDFGLDHGAGNSYHGDGKILRYGEFSVTKDNGNHIVSHCVLKKSNGMLYVVDHGGQRVMRIDISTGTVGGAPTYASGEGLTQHQMVTGYTWDEIISNGLQDPAGIEVIEDRLLVSDYATGEVIVYDISDPNNTPELGRISVGAGVMGIKIGPEGSIWGVNATNHNLFRIDAGPISVSEIDARPSWNLVPNPATSTVSFTGDLNFERFEIWDVAGRIVLQGSANEAKQGIDISKLGAGNYTVKVNNASSIAQQLIIVK